MTKHEFINRVMVIMNEASMTDKEGILIMGADNAQVDRYIESAYIDAWRRCITVMPKMWFENASFKSADVTPNKKDGTGYIVLPEDYYLLTEFKMKGWVKSISEASVRNDRNSNIQSNERTRGSIYRPALLLGAKDVGNEIKPVLEYFSLPKGEDKNHEIETAIYIPMPEELKELDMEDKLPLKEQVLEPLAYLVGSTVYTQFEKYDFAKALEMRAAEMYPGLRTEVKGVATTKQ